MGAVNMSIENLKKILESERLDTSKQYGLDMFPVQNIQTTKEFTQDVNFARRMTYSGAFKYGHEAATNRLLPLLENAFNILSEINIDNPSFEDSRLEWVEIQIDKSLAKEIREFLAEIKKESGE